MSPENDDHDRNRESSDERPNSTLAERYPGLSAPREPRERTDGFAGEPREVPHAARATLHPQSLPHARDRQGRVDRLADRDGRRVDRPLDGRARTRLFDRIRYSHDGVFGQRPGVLRARRRRRSVDVRRDRDHRLDRYATTGRPRGVRGRYRRGAVALGHGRGDYRRRGRILPVDPDVEDRR